MVTLPFSIGYFKLRIPRLDSASSSTKKSSRDDSHVDADGKKGRPTIDGKTARGASSPAKPALIIPSSHKCSSLWEKIGQDQVHLPLPLSMTTAEMSSSSFMFSDSYREVHSTKQRHQNAPLLCRSFQNRASHLSIPTNDDLSEIVVHFILVEIIREISKGVIYLMDSSFDEVKWSSFLSRESKRCRVSSNTIKDPRMDDNRS